MKVSNKNTTLNEKKETTFFRVYTKNGKDIEVDILANGKNELKRILFMAQLSIYRICKKYNITPDEILDIKEQESTTSNHSSQPKVKA